MINDQEFHVDRTEIIKLQKVDIVVNRRQTDISEQDLERLTTRVISEHRENPNQVVLSCWTMISKNYPKISFLDSENYPKYYVKKKWINPDHHDFRMAIKNDRGILGSGDDRNKTDWQSTDSILSEMSLSKHVKTLVQDKEAQNIFTSTGIKKLLFVEPLVGIIDRKKGEKYIIYQHINAAPWTTGMKREELFEATSMAKKLRDYFFVNGYSCTDLDERQFLFNRITNELYLIDTEGYFKNRPHP